MHTYTTRAAEKEVEFKQGLSDRIKELYDLKEEVCLSLEKLNQQSRMLAASKQRISKDDVTNLGVAYSECSLTLRRALLLMEKGHYALTMLHSDQPANAASSPYQQNYTHPSGHHQSRQGHAP